MNKGLGIEYLRNGPATLSARACCLFDLDYSVERHRPGSGVHERQVGASTYRSSKYLLLRYSINHGLIFRLMSTSGLRRHHNSLLQDDWYDGGVARRGDE